MRKRILVLITSALPILAQDQNWNIHFQAIVLSATYDPALHARAVEHGAAGVTS